MKLLLLQLLLRVAALLIALVPNLAPAIDIYFDSPDKANTVVVHVREKETTVACRLRNIGKKGWPRELELAKMDTDANYPFPRLIWAPDGRYLVVRSSYRKTEHFMMYEFPPEDNVKQLDTGDIEEASEDIGTRLVAAGKRDGKPWADGGVDFSGYDFAWPPKDGRIKVTLSGTDTEEQEFSVAMDFDVKSCKVSHVVVTINGHSETLPVPKKSPPTAPGKTGGR